MCLNSLEIKLHLFPNVLRFVFQDQNIVIIRVFSNRKAQQFENK